jgi:hypothetical protein
MRQDRRAAPQAIIGRFVIINQSWRILALLRGILINDQSGAERSGAERSGAERSGAERSGKIFFISLTLEIPMLWFHCRGEIRHKPFSGVMQWQQQNLS